MGIYDRPYMRNDSQGSGPAGGAGRWLLDHFNHVFIAICVLFWFLANGNEPGPNGIGQLNEVRDNLSLSLTNMSLHRYWTLLTGGMLEMGPINMLFSMLIIYYLGKGVAEIYGQGNLIWFYFWTLLITSGAYLLIAWLGHVPQILWYSSPEGLVMFLLVLITFWYPRRMIYVFWVVPCPMFLLTPIYVILLIYGFSQTNIYMRAFVAPALTGSALGMLVYFLDLRLLRGQVLPWRGGWLGKLANRFGGGAHGAGRVITRPGPTTQLERAENTYEYTEQPDRSEGNPISGRSAPVSKTAGTDDWDDNAPKLSAADAKRVDELLAKIANEGKDALSAEELAFLNYTSRKFR